MKARKILIKKWSEFGRVVSVSSGESSNEVHKRTKRVSECEFTLVGTDAEDPVVAKLSKIGCLEHHYKVQDCYFDTKDWRKCTQQVKEFQQFRVRFAPSPTGKLHIGGLRTAFYNYLFAKKYNGKFILRIEDTDQDRLKIDSIQNIIESLEWAGLEPDLGPHKNDNQEDGPWLQSKRLDIYHDYIKLLLDSKKAYHCFCDESRLSLLKRNAAKRQEKLSYDGKCRHLSDSQVTNLISEGRPYVIRFKLEDKEVVYNDLTTGIHKNNPFKQEGDFVLIKSDKFPTYHFANVVDDHLMRITHVLRGQEWQLSTSKHILLYEAFGWKHPVYAHLPLICNNDGSKISKRQNDIDVLSYRRNGYLPQSVLAYLSTFGGGLKVNILENFFKNSQNVLGELIENFDETQMSSRPVKLNPELLENINRRFIRLKLRSGKTERESLINELRDLVKNKFKMENSDLYLSIGYLESVLDWSQDRIFKLKDLVDDEKNMFLWTDMSNVSLDENLDLNTKENSKVLVEILRNFLSKKCEDLKNASSNAKLKKELNELFKSISKSAKSDGKMNYWKLSRLLLTGRLEGPPVLDIINLLGKDNVIYRLNIAEKILNKN
ncbi:unnamed protein product [Brachionus calyciflorus]|uniref:Nondiscriminating glutamyl-tRNA synthetase EARS2, mitochondrial n=1 Tax=Brachionus calyciflorus TaxID=104777 RepID=A0A814F5S5_9BILA|nr:unnamed protein product [Brachionus calyciflorus]